MNKPKVIYLQFEGKKYEPQFPEEITWCQDRINETDVEYVRADVVDQQIIDALLNLKGEIRRRALPEMWMVYNVIIEIDKLIAKYQGVSDGERNK